MKKKLFGLMLTGALLLGGAKVVSAAEFGNNTGYRNNNTTGVQSLVDGGASLEEAKQTMLDSKFERIDAAVERGVITQERADEIKAEITERSANCTGSGKDKSERPRYGLNKGLGGNGSKGTSK